MTISIDTSVLTAFYQARAGVSGTTTSGSSSTTSKNPTPPWGARSTAPQLTALTKSVLAGGRFIDENAAKLDVKTASADYKRLFSLYQGLNALQGLAEQYNAKGVSDLTRATLSKRFAAGMQEVSAYLDKTAFSGFELAQGKAADKIQATTGVKRDSASYTTRVLHTGSSSEEVAAFQGPTAFDVSFLKPSGSSVAVSFDLAEMGATPRTLSNVVIYLNGKLEAAGAASRFAVVRNEGTERTINAGGQTVSLGTGPVTYSLKFNGISTEIPTFSAPAAAPAVYVGQTMGTPAQAASALAKATEGNDSRQILKFSTDAAAGATDAADGKVFAKDLGPEVKAVRASTVGPDGSLYVLADVGGTTDGQAIKGKTDVALLKYDSAGALQYTRTLGASDQATGLALAVSADGARIAVAGSVTGALDTNAAVDDKTTADAFLSVYDGDGQELFTHRRTDPGADRIDSVSFGADNAVYVSGTTERAYGGAAQVGGQDAFIQGFKVGAVGGPAYVANFTTQYGTTGADTARGVAVSGSSLFTAGVENGEVVVRRYDLQAAGAPVLASTRSLGGLNGGQVAGVAVAADGSIVVAGSTHNGSLMGGGATTPYGGGQAAFVARFSADLGSSAQDALTYYNGADDLTVTGMAMTGNQVYLTGQAKIAGQSGAYDGYAVGLDAASGAVGWSQTFRGTDRNAGPTTIAVGATGASVLDRLGLPSGTMDFTGSSQVVAATSVRAGDQFVVRIAGGSASTITIEAGDTLKTLAEKINRATGFAARAEVIVEKGYDKLKITAASTRRSIEIEAGKGGRDALEALGLSEGLATSAIDRNKKDSVKAFYALDLPSTLSLDTTGTARQAQAMLITALSTIKSIYRDMTAPPAAKTGSGQVSAYLQNQIANYQQALNRLTA